MKQKIIILFCFLLFLCPVIWAKEKEISLTVKTETETVIDVYKIADYDQDTNQYSPNEKTEGFTPEINRYPTLDSSKRKSFAGRIASYLHKNQMKPDILGEKSNDKIHPLESGLYLVIARDANIDWKDSLVEEKDGVVSKITNNKITYAFEPELITLPYQDETKDNQWNDDVIMNLKPYKEDQMVEFILKKKYLSFYEKNPATSVFRIDVTKNGQTLYSNIETLTFEEAGEKEIKLSLPIDSVVQVSELYGGTNYSCLSSDIQTITLTENKNEMMFENDYVPLNHNGGSINNKFSYDKKGWDFHPVYDQKKEK